MLRLDRAPGRLVVVSRLARPHALAVLAAALLGAAYGGAQLARPLGWALAAAAVLVAGLGGRSTRCSVERGRVTVRHAVPLRRADVRRLSDFAAARVQTLGEERRRRAALRARAWSERSGAELPDWLRPPDAPATNDQLRRVVLVGAAAGELLPVTAWLDEDVEAARAELDATLRGAVRA